MKAEIEYIEWKPGMDIFNTKDIIEAEYTYEQKIFHRGKHFMTIIGSMKKEQDES